MMWISNTYLFFFRAIQHVKELNFNPFGAESKTVDEHLVNTMAVDALAPCIIRTSAAMVLSVWDKHGVCSYRDAILPV